MIFDMALSFKEKVIKVVLIIPKGKVMSYGQIAAWIGAPRAARQVGWVLRTIETEVKLPWWRVANNKGIISIKGNKYHNKNMQKSLLEKEGVKIREDLSFDIATYRFSPSLSSIERLMKD
jgi:methylated-DNA-protein-cysteine methyltransferase related protein